jgi:predicted metal-dependent hydrolase
MSSPERLPEPTAYDVQRRRRRTIGLSVRPDGTVEVRAPLRTSKAEIADMVESHQAWIEERRREHRARLERRRQRRFEHGDLVRFLGEDLRLQVIESAAAVPVDVERRDDDLLVTVAAGLEPAARRAAAREAVGRWLLSQAQRIFHEIHGAAARRVGDAAVSVTIKEMRSRWGSCGTNRKMSLSWRLVMAPCDVIEYVVVHELAHIRIADHSERFWARVAAACPGWRAARDWLRKHGDELEL